VDLDSNLDCDCEICKNYSMSKIKELYSGSQEDNYFAKILIFFHAIWQYEFLIKKIKMCNDEKKLFDFVNSIPDKNLRDDTILSLNFLRGLK